MPLLQNECKTFHINMSSAGSFIFMQIKVIFISMVSHLDLLWNRSTRELGNGLLGAWRTSVWMQNNFFFFFRFETEAKGNPEMAYWVLGEPTQDNFAQVPRLQWSGTKCERTLRDPLIYSTCSSPYLGQHPLPVPFHLWCSFLAIIWCFLPTEI